MVEGKMTPVKFRKGREMNRTRILPVVLAAMLSVCTNVKAFPAAAYAAETADPEETYE